MADQTRKPKPKKEEEQKADEKKAESSTQEVDDLLDEIDEVLEENSEDFVRSFVQKGGQAWIIFAIGTSFLSQLIDRVG